MRALAGQSIANIDQKLFRTMPDNLVPLSPLGRKQASEAGRKIKDIIGDESVRFYMSPYLCAAA